MDVVVLHEWPAVEHPALLQLLLRLRRTCGYRLLFHDTHYRVLTQPVRIARLGLERCDAILAFSPSLAAAYRERLGLGPERVHVVHEAADDALFRPLPARPAPAPRTTPSSSATGAARTGPASCAPSSSAPPGACALSAASPSTASATRRRTLRVLQERCGIEYRGWLPNHRVPQALAQARAVLHIPRRQYVRVLHGTPTIRVFEALACAAPLVSTPWPDTDGLFRAGAGLPRRGHPETDGGGPASGCGRTRGPRGALGHSGRERILARAHLPPPRGADPGHRRRPARGGRGCPPPAQPPRRAGARRHCRPVRRRRRRPWPLQERMNIVVFGSSIVSAYWNGAGDLLPRDVPGPQRAGAPHPLRGAGHLRPPAPPRPGPEDPPYCEVRVVSGWEALERELRAARAEADLIVKGNDSGAFDREMEDLAGRHRPPPAAGGLLGRGRPGDPGRVRRPGLVPASPDPPLRLRLHLRRGRPGGGGLPGPGRPPRRPGVQRRRPGGLPPGAPGRGPAPATSCSWATACRTARPASGDFFLGAAERAPEARFVLGGAGLGRAAPAPQRARHRPLPHRPAPGAQLQRPPGAEPQPRGDGRHRLLARRRASSRPPRAGPAWSRDTWEGIDRFFAPGEEVLLAGGPEDLARFVAHGRPGRGPGDRGAGPPAGPARPQLRHPRRHLRAGGPGGDPGGPQRRPGGYIGGSTYPGHPCYSPRKRLTWFGERERGPRRRAWPGCIASASVWPRTSSG